MNNKINHRSELTDKLNEVAKRKGWRDYTDLNSAGRFDYEVDTIIQTYAEEFSAQQNKELIEANKNAKEQFVTSQTDAVQKIQQLQSELSQQKAGNKMFEELVEAKQKEIESWKKEKFDNVEEYAKTIDTLKQEIDGLKKEREKLADQNVLMFLALKNLETEAGDLMDFCIDRGHLDNEDLTDGQIAFNRAMADVRKFFKTETTETLSSPTKESEGEVKKQCKYRIGNECELISLSCTYPRCEKD